MPSKCFQSVRYHLPVGKCKLKSLESSPQSGRLLLRKQRTTNAGEAVGEGELSPTVGVGVKGVLPPCKSVWRFLEKVKLELPYDPVIPLLDILPTDSTSCYRAIWTLMFVAALVTVARSWNKPVCPPADEKAVHLHKGVLYSCKEKIKSWNLQENRWSQWGNLERQMPRICLSHMWLPTLKF